jgi:hypothetical protein
MSDVDLFGQPIEEKASMRAETIVPPFSVLDARDGRWQQRKTRWLAMGIQSEIGRGANLGGGGTKPTMNHITRGTGKEVREAFEQSGAGASIFDPVLTEILLTWFCKKEGRVLDPFAGGSVRGIVSSHLGFRYTGIDLSEAQVAANREQAAKLCPPPMPMPEWIVADSSDLATLLPPGDLGYHADMILTCPPYGDLERYSDDPRDLSTWEHDKFVAGLGRILRLAMARLWSARFACVVIGDIRDTKTGALRNLVADTVAECTRGTGATLHNDLIYVTPVGSLPFRAGLYYDATRKIGRTHQVALVFCKGSPDSAVSAINTAAKPAAPAWE